jgi:drug/metabolite transporter (DMT)-like permease
MSEAWLGYGLSGAALLLFTTATLLTQPASERVPLSLGFLLATASNVLFSALAWLVQRLLQGPGEPFHLQAFLYFVTAGVLATYLGRWFFYESVVRFGPAKASVFQVSSPLFTALIAWLVLGEHLQPQVFLAIGVAMAGLLLVSFKPGGKSPSPQPATKRASLVQSLMSSVLLLGVGSSLAYSMGHVLRGAAVRDWNEPILGGLLGAIAGLLLNLLTSPEKRELLARLRAADRRGCWFYAFIGIFTISGQICSIGAMRYIPISVAALMPLCTPLLMFPLSHWLLKSREEITPALLVGSAMTLAGIAIVVLR